MIVLFKNIPENTYHNDISDFVCPVIKGGLFSKQGHIRNIEIIALQEINTESLEFQALANIEPDVVANRAIKKLHGVFLRGRRIVVREYFLRSWKNDKRSEEKPLASTFNERRRIPCRRRKLKMFKIATPEYV